MTAQISPAGSRDRVRAALQQTAAPVCDDCLPALAGLKSRQDARRLCLELDARGDVHRGRGMCAVCGKTKSITTADPGAHDTLATPPLPPGQAPSQPVVAPITQRARARREQTAASGQPGAGPHPWYWEGNIQSALVSWLAHRGFAIKRVADTASHEPGVDIIAVDADGKELWVSVKGYPESERHHTPARHTFGSAVFDLVLYRDARSDVGLALAFPDGFTTYTALAARLGSLRRVMPFTIYWVSEAGGVSVA